MKNLKFLPGVIFLIGVFVLVGLAGKAHAFYGGLYRCCSEVTYYFELKGSPDQELFIRVVNLNVLAGCLNEQDNSLDCKSGEGNTGSFTIDATSSSNITYKDKSTVKVSGSIPLDRFTNHYIGDTLELTPACDSWSDTTDCHIHVCHPLGSPNKVEIKDSVYVPTLDVYYDILNPKNNKKESSHQTCYWPGKIRQDTCEVIHDGDGPNGEVRYICEDPQPIN